MNNLINTNYVYSKEQIRQMERDLFKYLPDYSVMFFAAISFVEKIKQLHKHQYNFSILVGSGNNGGDGLVIAGLLKQYNYSVNVYLTNPPKTKSAQKALEFAKSQQVSISLFNNFKSDKNTIIIDAILGIGFNKKLSDDYQKIIEKTNQIEKHSVVAVDIPSGLCADTGYYDKAIIADKTISFIGDKKGFYTGAAKSVTGEVYIALLGNKLIKSSIKSYTINHPKPPSNKVHKGSFGHSLIIGGGEGMFGAACLSSIAAIKSGSGRVSMYTHKIYESQYHVKDTPIYEIMRNNQLTDLSNYSSICIGPGLGRNQWGEKTYLQTIDSINQLNKPLVIDADGLYHLAKHPTTWNKHTVILTPHESEAATLLNCPIDEIISDRFSAVLNIAHKYNCIVVLKGFNTLICDKENIYINQTGNYQLATAGSGDVLSGIISGYLHYPYKVIENICFAVSLHGLSADLYQKNNPIKSMRAVDIIDYLGSLAIDRDKKD